MCIWKEKPSAIIDVPEDKPIVAYKYLKRAYFDDDTLMSPYRTEVRWKIGKKISSRTKDPLMSSEGLKVGVYAFASIKPAKDRAVPGSHFVAVKVHLWGKVAIQKGEPYVKYFGWAKKIRNDKASRYKGYRAQHAKLVKVY